MLGILCELEKGPRVAVFQTFQESLDWLVHVFPDKAAGKATVQQFY
jgi:hypothetical protein